MTSRVEFLSFTTPIARIYFRTNVPLLTAALDLLLIVSVGGGVGVDDKTVVTVGGDAFRGLR